MRRLRIETPGPRTTVEDLGRRGVARFGVPPGGAFDPLSLAEANRAVGNPASFAGLEVTLEGPSLRNVGDEPLLLEIVGGEFVGPAGGSAPGPGVLLRPGEIAAVARPLPWARAWIAVGGGIEVPLVLGSRSTCLPGRFGGFEGRALSTGDTLTIGPVPAGSARPRRFIPGPSEPTTSRGRPVLLRLLPGPQVDLWPRDPLPLLASTLWTVAHDSDRVGVRLHAVDPEVASRIERPAGIAPHGTVPGAMQLPPDASAILLGPDRPVTGGYAMPAVLARADVGLLARARPGDRVRFEAVGVDDARKEFPRGPRRRIDLNADVGEGFPEQDLMRFLTSASIACGAHAGDAATMRRTIALALEHGLAIGAHPGFEDREGFGRRITTRDPEEIVRLVTGQVARLDEACREAGAVVAYVKPHGALYNLASAEPEIALAIARAVALGLPARPLVLAANSPGLAAVLASGGAAVPEAFVDRGYRDDATLVPRTEPGARIDDPAEAAHRAVSLASEGTVASNGGRELDLAPATLCLHGDTPGAAEIARAVRDALDRAGVAVVPFGPRLPSAPGIW